MTHWTVDAPTALEFDDVTELNVRLIGGTVAVLASDDRPALAVSELTGRPLQVSHSGGVLTVSYESLSWDGLLGFLKPRKDSAAVTITVPADCPIQLGVLSASAIVTGLHAGAAVKGMSGDITLAGGSVESLAVDTLSGQVTADVSLGKSGSVRVTTMSGEVTLRLPADSDAQVHLHSKSGGVRTEFESLRTVKAPASHTVSGNVGAGTGHVSVTTMSGTVTLL